LLLVLDLKINTVHEMIPEYPSDCHLLADQQLRKRFPMKPVELGYDGGWEYIEISQPRNKTKQHHISTEKLKNYQVRNSINHSHGIWKLVEDIK